MICVSEKGRADGAARKKLDCRWVRKQRLSIMCSSRSRQWNPVEVINKLLAHAKLSTTVTDLQVSTNRMMTSYNRAHLHARNKRGIAGQPHFRSG
jgi:hypothetical protein